MFYLDVNVELLLRFVLVALSRPSVWRSGMRNLRVRKSETVVFFLRRQEDAALQELRFRLVPRRVSEEQFWQRYFAAAAELRHKALGSGGRYGEYGSVSHHSGGGGVSSGGRAMSEHSTSTAAGMSIVAGSSGSPGAVASGLRSEKP
jgi:uncharacterized membrane protein YgcG